MDSPDPSPSEDILPTFYIGQHESKRLLPVTSELLQQAHDFKYDFLTSPITTPHFHSRVLTLLSSNLLRPESTIPTADGSFLASQPSPPLVVPPLTALDSPLAPNETISQLLAVSSPWIDLCSPDPVVADVSRQVLNLEAAYAAFCNVRNVIIPGPRLHNGQTNSDGVVKYARAIREILGLGQYINFQIWLPMAQSSEADREDGLDHLCRFAREEFTPGPEDDRSRKMDFFGTWDAWNVIRTMCNYSTRLSVALALPRQLPPYPVQSRWHSEPLQIISLEARSFVKNAKGYNVLSRAHQAYIHKLMRLRAPPWILLCDVGPIPGMNTPDAVFPTSDVLRSPITPGLGGESSNNSSGSPSPAPAEASNMPPKPRKRVDDATPHLAYLRNLEKKKPQRTAIEKFGGPIYQDFLQAPLQPLTVNLESLTYEVFEQDPVKYDCYERAIAAALLDWHKLEKPTSSPEGRVVIAVVGAGRGPLVTRVLRASEQTGIAVEVWALEKNPNAFVILQHHNEETWGGRVNLVQSDMRGWKGPWRESIVTIPNLNLSATPGQAITSDSEPSLDESPIAINQINHTPIDVLVSELLGSFGDNELAPECLDGVVHLLNPGSGISIPSSYSAHLTPISTPRLYADISSRVASDRNAPETPWVVWLHAVDYLSSTPPPEPASTPNPDQNPSASQTQSAASKNHRISTAQILSQTPPTPVVHTAWTFHHGWTTTQITTASPLNLHNVRSATLRFPAPHHGVIHGLGGYFTAILYASSSSSSTIPSNTNPGPSSSNNGDDNDNNTTANKDNSTAAPNLTFPSSIELTTNPITIDEKSSGMISWFPIFFPLKTPLWVPDDGEIEVGIWRCTDGRKVWYEWCVEVWKWEFSRAGGGAGDVDDGGRRKRIRVGLSEMHSSIKQACLM